MKSKRISGYNGYGSAALGMLKSLRNLGYEVKDNDKTADVEIWFDQPHHIKWGKAPYRIAYFPWESTKLLHDWDQLLNTADEVWTPSPLIASWMPGMGIRKPVYVYEHGIGKKWVPRQRKDDGVVKYLIVGAEATRKNGFQSMSAYHQADVPHSTLTIKTVGHTWNQMGGYGRKTFINDTYTHKEMRKLFYANDVLIHLSSGEGFGLPPLQAIASGMPAIVVPAWAPYARFLDPNLCIDSTLVPSAWEKLHPGMIFRPDWTQARDAIQYVYDNFTEVADRAFEIAPDVHSAYNWDALTAKAFTALESRLSAK